MMKLAQQLERRLLATLSASGFLLLFPGFYIYHDLVARGVAPPLLGGFFTPVALGLVALFLLSLHSVFIHATKASKAYFALLLFFLIWVLTTATTNKYLAPSPESDLVFVQSMQVVLQWGALFFVGQYIDLKNRWLRVFTYGAGALIVAQLLWYVAETGSVFYSARRLALDEESVASYQGFGRSALMLSLLAIAWTRGSLATVLIVVGSLFALFVLGARSEFLGFVFAITMYLGLRSVRVKREFFSAMFVLSAAIFLLWMFSGALIESRQAQILDIDSASSWVARQEMQDRALSQISDHWVFGEFAGHVNNGSTGHYSHNALSAWVSFGAPGFFLYVSLCAWPLFYSAKLLVREVKVRPEDAFLFLSASASFILIVGAKSVFSAFPAFVWGLYLGHRLHCRRPAQLAVGKVLSSDLVWRSSQRHDQ